MLLLPERLTFNKDIEKLTDIKELNYPLILKNIKLKSEN